MKLLCFDTSTDRLHVGVRHGEQVCAADEPGGARASDRLIPLIFSLLAEANLSLAELDAIGFGEGPGSFTGLRTASAVAQGLAFGANLPVLPIATLMAVAEQARLQTQANRVCVAMDARMTEVYTQSFAFDGGHWRCSAIPARALAPEHLQVADDEVLCGDAHGVYGERFLHLNLSNAQFAAPTGLALLGVARQLWQSGVRLRADQAQPVYVRNKVAQTTVERDEAKRIKAELAEIADAAPCAPPR